jgi:hypothetical protein
MDSSRHLELGMQRIDGHLMSLGFNKSVVNPNQYYKTINSESLNFGPLR